MSLTIVAHLKQVRTVVVSCSEVICCCCQVQITVTFLLTWPAVTHMIQCLEASFKDMNTTDSISLLTRTHDFLFDKRTAWQAVVQAVRLSSAQFATLPLTDRSDTKVVVSYSFVPLCLMFTFGIKNVCNKTEISTLTISISDVKLYHFSLLYAAWRWLVKLAETCSWICTFNISISCVRLICC